MKCLSVIIILTIAQVITGSEACSQTTLPYLIRQVKLKGLPADSYFSSLQQDDDGFMWIGTLSGLYRYDGSRVTRFLNDPADSNSLSHNYTNTLTKDSKGNVWIGTYGGFMNMYDRNSGRINRIEPGLISYSRVVVVKTKIALGGNVLAITSQGMYKINLAGYVTDSVLFFPEQPKTDIVVTDFIEYEQDKFIITSATGLFFLDWNNRKLRAADMAPALKMVTSIEKDKDGNFWLGTVSGLVIMKRDFSITGNTGYIIDTGLNNNSISCIQRDSAGRMWIGTGKGLFLGEHKTIKKIQPSNTPFIETIHEMFADANGIVWFSVPGKGLFQVYMPGITFQTIPNMEKYSQKNLIQSILEEKPGSWIIGTKVGLYRYSFLSNKFEEIDLTGKKDKLWIGAQLVDKNKGYWVATWGQGVFYRADGANKFIQFTKQEQDENSLPFNTIVALEEDKHGNIWMGSFSGGGKSDGLCYYNPGIKKIYRLSANDGAKAFKANDISQIETDEQGNVSIGTWDGGLYYYYGSGIVAQQNAFNNYSYSSARPQKISHNIVSCVRPATNGKIWFGTMSGGLNVLDTKTQTVDWFTLKNGIASNLIYRIEEDDQGIIWMSQDNGIARFDPATKSFINYNTTSGLPVNNFTFLTSMKCADGTIAFGTSDGQVVYFNPNSSKNLINTRPVVITDIRLFNKSLETGSASLLKKAAYLTDTLRLKYDHSVISFELSNMDFLNPEIYTYAYKLEGFDKDWTHITDRNSVTYTNLDPGTYTLLLKNADHYGTWNETPTKLVLIIKPPFWRTWWFISLVIAIIATLIYAIFRYRLQQKLKLFAVRNRLHRDLHDDVGATLSSVKAYSEILKDNPNNPVIAELIRDNSTEMIERLEVIAWATNPQHDHFKSLKNKMIKFAAPLCHSKNIQCHIETKGINEEMLMAGELRQNIFLVFKEAINNMIKYSDATTCNTQLFIRSNLFVLQITDNGKGFDGTTKGTGSGWKNMQKRTADLNGKLAIDSTPEKGTVITMSLPYPFKIPSSWDKKQNG